MSQEGVQNDDGTFVSTTIEDITDRKIEKAEEEFGPNVDLSQSSPIKQIIDVTAEEHEYIWNLLEDVYYSAYYSDAHDEQLDKLLSITSIRRTPRRGATGVVNFISSQPREEDVVIREGTRVATEATETKPSIPFKTTEPARLEAGETAVNGVPIRACEPWETDLDERWLGEETNVASDTITKFETPIQQISRVTNPYPTGETSRAAGYSFVEGRDRETDAELRARWEKQFGSQAHATLDAIRAALLDLNGVKSVGMEENTSMEDKRPGGGLPPKSFRSTILGDVPNTQVAQTIYEIRPAGIQSYGEVSAMALDTEDKERVERWDWAERIDVYADITVSHTDEYPSDGNEKIQNKVIEYIGGEKFDGGENLGTEMGEDVIYDMVHTAAMSVTGVWRAEVELGTDEGDPSTDDIVIEEKEAALTDYEKVNVFNNEESVP